MTLTQTDVTRLHERLDEILKAIQAIELESGNRLTTLETQRLACRADVTRMYECLFGNGKPGLVSEVREMRTLSGLKSRWFWLLATAIPATASGLCGAVIGAVTAKVF